MWLRNARSLVGFGRIDRRGTVKNVQLTDTAQLSPEFQFHANLRSVREKQIGGAKELVLVGTCKEGVVRAR